MDKLEKIHARIVADLEEFRIKSADVEPPADMVEDFKTARRQMVIAEIAVKNAPCFGGGGSNSCPPLPAEYC